MNPIKELLIGYGENDGWYNPKKILPYFDSCMMYWVVGERRIGKTDMFLRLACDLWRKYGKKTMWIRNKAVELQDPSFHADFLNDAVKLGWADEEWICKSDGVYEDDSKDAERFILFQSISTFSNRRGGAHPDVLMMVLDEFMPEDRKYPKNCAMGLMSLTKTVFSGNTEARCFCLSNFVSAGNPYFVAFQIYPSATDDVTPYPDKGCCIERCTGYRRAIETGNPWNKVYKAGKYGDYADDSEDSLTELIRPVPKGSNPQRFVLLIDGLYYMGWSKNGLVYWDLYKGSLNKMIIFTPNLKECSDTVRLLPNTWKNLLAEQMEGNALRFKTPNVLYAVLRVVYTEV